LAELGELCGVASITDVEPRKHVIWPAAVSSTTNKCALALIDSEGRYLAEIARAFFAALLAPA
jgi:hypothetical protein